jgi:hypothetical protein
MERSEILATLTAVGRLLQNRGLQGDLYLVGGAAMAVAYDARRSTRQVDAIFEPKLAIYEAAAAMARDRGLPPDWLNDAVKGFITVRDPYDGVAIDLPGLRVQAASPQMLLALKVLAARVGEDDDDVAWLAQHLGLGTADEVLDMVVSVIGEERLSSRSQFFVEAVMES